MRLVDVDAVIMAVDKHTFNENSLDDDISCILEEVPTAYDVDKVLEQIKKSAIKMSSAKLPHKYFKAIGTRLCEKIIRSG